MRVPQGTAAAALAALFLSAPAALAQNSPPETHQGFFLRLQGGLGYLRADADYLGGNSRAAYGGSGVLVRVAEGQDVTGHADPLPLRARVHRAILGTELVDRWTDWTGWVPTFLVILTPSATSSMPRFALRIDQVGLR